MYDDDKITLNGKDNIVVFDTVQTMSKEILDRLYLRGIKGTDGDLSKEESIANVKNKLNVKYRKNVELITDPAYKKSKRAQIKDLLSLTRMSTYVPSHKTSKEYHRESENIIKSFSGGENTGYLINEAKAKRLADMWENYGRDYPKEKKLRDIGYIKSYPTDYTQLILNNDTVNQYKYLENFLKIKEENSFRRSNYLKTFEAQGNKETYFNNYLEAKRIFIKLYKEWLTSEEAFANKTPYGFLQTIKGTLALEPIDDLEDAKYNKDWVEDIITFYREKFYRKDDGNPIDEISDKDQYKDEDDNLTKLKGKWGNKGITVPNLQNFTISEYNVAIIYESYVNFDYKSSFSQSEYENKYFNELMLRLIYPNKKETPNSNKKNLNSWKMRFFLEDIDKEWQKKNNCYSNFLETLPSYENFNFDDLDEKIKNYFKTKKDTIPTRKELYLRDFIYTISSSHFFHYSSAFLEFKCLVKSKNQLSRTLSNEECQPWLSNEVHYEGDLWKFWEKPLKMSKNERIEWKNLTIPYKQKIGEGMLEYEEATETEKLKTEWKTHNNCRNPGNRSAGPWCYTKNPNKRWEYCNKPNYTNYLGKVVLFFVFIFVIIVAFLTVKTLFSLEYPMKFVASLTGGQISSTETFTNQAGQTTTTSTSSNTGGRSGITKSKIR